MIKKSKGKTFYAMTSKILKAIPNDLRNTHKEFKACKNYVIAKEVKNQLSYLTRIQVLQ